MRAGMDNHYNRWNKQEVFPHNTTEIEAKNYADTKPNSFHNRPWKNQGIYTSLWHP